MKIGETAKLLGISDNTVRNWVTEYAHLFTAQARGEIGRQRTFTEDDVLLLATIATLRNDGIEFTEIQKRLVGGERVDHPGMANFGVDTRMIPAAAMEQMVDATGIRIELEQIKAERDRMLMELEERKQSEKDLRTENRTLLDKIAELENKLGHAEGRLVELTKKKGWFS